MKTRLIIEGRLNIIERLAIKRGSIIAGRLALIERPITKKSLLILKTV